MKGNDRTEVCTMRSELRRQTGKAASDERSTAQTKCKEIFLTHHILKWQNTADAKGLVLKSN